MIGPGSRSSSVHVLCHRCGGVVPCWPLMNVASVGSMIRGRVTCFCAPADVAPSAVSHLSQPARHSSQTEREPRSTQLVPFLSHTRTVAPRVMSRIPNSVAVQLNCGGSR